MSNLERYAALSGRALQLKFKKYLNKTPFQYIQEQKMLKAHELIKEHQRSKTISEIALELKFSHLGRFSVNFKKRFGIHPSVLARS
jgi:AraC-like DNA-binding protein